MKSADVVDAIEHLWFVVAGHACKAPNGPKRRRPAGFFPLGSVLKEWVYTRTDTLELGVFSYPTSFNRPRVGNITPPLASAPHEAVQAAPRKTCER